MKSVEKYEMTDNDMKCMYECEIEVEVERVSVHIKIGSDIPNDTSEVSS